MGLPVCEACGTPRSFASPNVAVCPTCVARAMDIVRKALPHGAPEFVTAFAPPAPPARVAPRSRRWLYAAAGAFVAASLAVTGALAAEFVQSLGHPHVRLGPRAYHAVRAMPTPPPFPLYAVPARQRFATLGAGPVPAFAMPTTQAPPVPAPAHAAPFLGAPGQDNHDPLQLLTRAASMMRRGADITIQRTTLPRSALDRFSASILSSAPSAHVEPCFRGGQALGLSIDRITPGSPLELAGVINHDVIASINGYPTVSSYGTSSRGFAPVGGPTLVVAEVLRGGQWVVLAVDWSAASTGG